MSANQQLINEIVDGVSKLPIECQEKLLDVVKAMAFTREVMKKECKTKQYECTEQNGC